MFNGLERHLPRRFSVWLSCAVVMLLAAFTWVAFRVGGTLALVCMALVGIGFRDVRQERHPSAYSSAPAAPSLATRAFSTSRR